MRMLAAVAVVCAGCAGLTACGNGTDATSDTRASASAVMSERLAGYTDPGDGCEQVVSAISYAEFLLKPLGQERYQDLDQVVLSRIAAVAGTVAVEAADFPDGTSAEQAARLAAAAEHVDDPEVTGEAKVAALREYRSEAADTVIACAAAVPGL